MSNPMKNLEVMQQAANLSMDDLQKQIHVFEGYAKTCRQVFELRKKDGEMTTEMIKRAEKKQQKNMSQSKAPGTQEIKPSKPPVGTHPVNAEEV